MITTGAITVIRIRVITITAGELVAPSGHFTPTSKITNMSHI
jgi:hypothetical protein